MCLTKSRLQKYYCYHEWWIYLIPNSCSTVIYLMPMATVYQRQLSLSSHQGLLVITSKRWGVNGYTTWCTSPVSCLAVSVLWWLTGPPSCSLAVTGDWLTGQPGCSVVVSGQWWLTGPPSCSLPVTGDWLTGQPGWLFLLLWHFTSPNVLHCTGEVCRELMEDGRPNEGHEQPWPYHEWSEERRSYTLDGRLLCWVIVVQFIVMSFSRCISWDLEISCFLFFVYSDISFYVSGIMTLSLGKMESLNVCLKCAEITNSRFKVVHICSPAGLLFLTLVTRWQLFRIVNTAP